MDYVENLLVEKYGMSVEEARNVIGQIRSNTISPADKPQARRLEGEAMTNLANAETTQLKKMEYTARRITAIMDKMGRGEELAEDEMADYTRMKMAQEREAEQLQAKYGGRPKVTQGVQIPPQLTNGKLVGADPRTFNPTEFRRQQQPIQQVVQMTPQPNNMPMQTQQVPPQGSLQQAGAGSAGYDPQQLMEAWYQARAAGGNI